MNSLQYSYHILHPKLVFKTVLRMFKPKHSHCVTKCCISLHFFQILVNSVKHLCINAISHGNYMYTCNQKLISLNDTQQLHVSVHIHNTGIHKCPVEQLPLMCQGYKLGIYKSLCDAQTSVQGCTFTLQVAIQLPQYSAMDTYYIAKTTVTSVFTLQSVATGGFQDVNKILAIAKLL